MSNRVLAIRALCGNRMVLERLSDCDDTRVMRTWLESRPDVVDVGASGTAMRFSTALLAVIPGVRVITGSERMCHRPIGILVEALRGLGAEVEYVGQEGFPPLRVTGMSHLQGGDISLSGSVSSQYISALMLVGPMLKSGLRLTLNGRVVSRPYIDLTMAVMRDCGAKVRWETDADGEERRIVVEAHPYQPCAYRVEGDWSAASYWYEAVALAPNADAEVRLTGLNAASRQGDSRVAALFEDLGVATRFGADGVTLTRHGRTAPRVDCDLADTPDLAQTLVVACCMRGLPFRITGLDNLRIKETDRLAALRVELAKLGFAVGESGGNTLSWDGIRRAASGEVAIDTYDDHRMAMAFAPVAAVDGGVWINDPQVVSKSYPRFWDDLRALGFGIESEWQDLPA